MPSQIIVTDADGTELVLEVGVGFQAQESDTYQLAYSAFSADGSGIASYTVGSPRHELVIDLRWVEAGKTMDAVRLAAFVQKRPCTLVPDSSDQARYWTATAVEWSTIERDGEVGRAGHLFKSTVRFRRLDGGEFV